MRAKSPPKTPGSSVYPTPRLFPGPFSTSYAARHGGRMWRDLGLGRSGGEVQGRRSPATQSMRGHEPELKEAAAPVAQA
jgi:hypothetical protein